MLLYYLQSKNTLNTLKYRFRKGRSAIQVISRLVDDDVRALVKGEVMGLPLCDLRGAFSHYMFETKLCGIAIRGSSLRILQSFITDRKQCVSIVHNIWDLTVLKSGILPVSILGPLLLIVYINNLFNNVLPYTCIYYADAFHYYIVIRIRNCCLQKKRLCLWSIHMVDTKLVIIECRKIHETIILTFGNYCRWKFLLGNS